MRASEAAAFQSALGEAAIDRRHATRTLARTLTLTLALTLTTDPNPDPDFNPSPSPSP